MQGLHLIILSCKYAYYEMSYTKGMRYEIFGEEIIK